MFTGDQFKTWCSDFYLIWFMLLSADWTNPTHTPMWKVKGWGGKATRNSMSTFTGNSGCSSNNTVNVQFNMTSSHSSSLSFFTLRNNVLKVKEVYQYPKLDEGTNETDVFSREPFIVRFHSPTTCKNPEVAHYYITFSETWVGSSLGFGHADWMTGIYPGF